MEWKADDVRAWRARMGWTQSQAAAALTFHLQAYKKLECGTRRVTEHMRLACKLVEREHVRASTGPSTPSSRDKFATADLVVSRMEALARSGALHLPDGTPRLRILSCFSGLEAASAAAEKIGLGAVLVAFSDTDDAANSVYKSRWPGVPRIGDIRDFDAVLLRGQVDLIIGGPPCQSFSVASDQLGLDDPRGQLALDYIRAIGIIRPTNFILENVEGMLSANQGRDFGRLLDEVDEIGFSCAWSTLEASDFGLPQDRNRLVLVGEADPSDRGPAAILALEKGQDGLALSVGERWKAPASRSSPASRGVMLRAEPDWSLPGSWNPVRGSMPTRLPTPANDEVISPAYPRSGRQPVGGSLARSSRRPPDPTEGEATTRQLLMVNLRNNSVSATLCPTLLTKGNSLYSNPVVIQERDGKLALRRLMPIECLRLQGLDDDWLDGARLRGKPLSDTVRYRLIGNAFAVPMIAWLLERLDAHKRLHGAVAGTNQSQRLRRRASPPNHAVSRCRASMAGERSAITSTPPRLFNWSIRGFVREPTAIVVNAPVRVENDPMAPFGPGRRSHGDLAELMADRVDGQLPHWKARNPITLACRAGPGA